MSFWGPPGPQTPAALWSIIIFLQHSVLSSQKGPEMFLSLYNERTKKFGFALKF